MASLTFKDNSGTNVASLLNIKSIVYEDAAQNKYTFGVDNTTNVFNTFKYEPNGTAEVDYSSIAVNFMTNGAVDGLLGKLTTIETATNATNLGDKVAAIKTKTDFIPDTFTADVADIKAKTDKMPDDLEGELDILPKLQYMEKLVVPLAKTAELAPLVAPLAKTAELDPLAKTAELAPLAKTADVDAIKAKTDKIPDDLGTNLTTIKTATDKIADIVTNVGAIKTKTDMMPADLNDKLTELTIIAKALNSDGDVTEAAKNVLGRSFKKAIEDAGDNGSDWLTKEIKEIASQPSFEIPKDSSEALSWYWS